jgi:hypothetical protein
MTVGTSFILKCGTDAFSVYSMMKILAIGFSLTFFPLIAQACASLAITFGSSQLALTSLERDQTDPYSVKDL